MLRKIIAKIMLNLT